MPDDPGVYGEDGFRIAIASRLPSVAPPNVRKLLGYNCQMRVCLRWGDRTLALYGVHPNKPFPYRQFAGTWRQRRELLDWLDEEALPTIVAGDFNSPPGSAFLRRFEDRGYALASRPGPWGRTRDLADAAQTRGCRFRVAIDHILIGSEFRCRGFEVGPTTNSDHAPILAEITW